jgi:hypothetical protein
MTMDKQEYSGPPSLNFMSGLLAFVLSALMGIVFVTLVDKTHHLFANAAPAAFEEQTVVGTWHGKWHGVPSVMVTIDRDGEQLSGIVVFQAVRQTENGPKLTGAPVRLPLKEARFDGKTLHFKLDDPGSSKELRNTGIEMILTSDNQAELRIASTNHDGYEQEESVTLIKHA